MKISNKILVWFLVVQFFTVSTSFAQVVEPELPTKNIETQPQAIQDKIPTNQPQLSIIEKLFNTIPADNQIIEQFGYEIFENGVGSTSARIP